MNNINENQFKSLSNSNNERGLDWAIISMRITKRPPKFKHTSKFYLCREIAYLDKDNRIYQVGRLYIPANRIKNLLFFIRLAFSKITFGHFVSEYFKGKYEFKVIESSDPIQGYNLLFNPNSLIKYSKRVVEIRKTKYKFYVEEEFEVI